MKNTLTYIALFLFISGCSNSHKKFNSYISSIQTIPTPLNFRTLNDPKRPQGIPDKNLFSKYKYCYADDIYGKLFETENYIGILYSVNGDVLTPVLMTYDKIGNKIDSLNLFENATGFNENHMTYVSSTLYSDMTIREIDSTFIPPENEIEGIPFAWKKIIVDTIHFSLNLKGKIVKH